MCCMCNVVEKNLVGLGFSRGEVSGEFLLRGGILRQGISAPWEAGIGIPFPVSPHPTCIPIVNPCNTPFLFYSLYNFTRYVKHPLLYFMPQYQLLVVRQSYIWLFMLDHSEEDKLESCEAKPSKATLLTINMQLIKHKS